MRLVDWYFRAKKQWRAQNEGPWMYGWATNQQWRKRFPKEINNLVPAVASCKLVHCSCRMRYWKKELKFYEYPKLPARQIEEARLAQGDPLAQIHGEYGGGASSFSRGGNALLSDFFGWREDN